MSGFLERANATARSLPKLSVIAPATNPPDGHVPDLAAIAEAMGMDLAHHFRKDEVGCCMVCGLHRTSCIGEGGTGR